MDVIFVGCSVPDDRHTTLGLSYMQLKNLTVTNYMVHTE